MKSLHARVGFVGIALLGVAGAFLACASSGASDATGRSSAAVSGEEDAGGDRCKARRKQHHDDGDKDKDKGGKKDNHDRDGDDDCAPTTPPPPPPPICPSGTHLDPCDPFRLQADPSLPVPGTPSQMAGGCCLDGVFTCPDAGLVCPPTKCGDNSGQQLCCDLVNGALANCTPP